VLESLCGHEIACSQCLDCGRVLIHAERWIEIIENKSTIKDRRNLKGAQLKTMNVWAKYAVHGRNQNEILLLSLQRQPKSCKIGKYKSTQIQKH
jgi:hypothetical protein